MRIVIIEDEIHTANHLAGMIQQLDKGITIDAVLDSVATASAWFRKNDLPDLIFSDIQLGDGLCFEIFQNEINKVPVIFCTAYDEYALNAFKANGIDYLLKPISSDMLESALNKYKRLNEPDLEIMRRMEEMIRMYSTQKQKVAESVLVYVRDKVIPVRLEEIALIFIENDITHLLTFNKLSYTLNKTMDEAETLAGNLFFRTNRQFLVNRNAIKDASQYFSRTLVLNLTLPFAERITVSKNRVSDFLKWLEKE